MLKMKAWEGTLAEIEERRQQPKLKLVASAPKGRPPQRSRPMDFDIIFVEIGRLDCETYYRASRITVNRWLDETPGGKGKLIRKRADYVQMLRDAGLWLTRSSSLVEVRAARPERKAVPIRDRRKVSFRIARAAAQYLRVVRNGGWIVSQAPDDAWRVGSRLLSAAQMVDLAVTRGFDRLAAALQVEGEDGVGQGG